jgi:hypothetical protein
MEDDGFKICPFCKEKIRKEAVKCRFCGEWLEQGEQEHTSSSSAEMVTPPFPIQHEPPAPDRNKITPEIPPEIEKEPPPKLNEPQNTISKTAFWISIALLSITGLVWIIGLSMVHWGQMSPVQQGEETVNLLKFLFVPGIITWFTKGKSEKLLTFSVVFAVMTAIAAYYFFDARHKAQEKATESHRQMVSNINSLQAYIQQGAVGNVPEFKPTGDADTDALFNSMRDFYTEYFQGWRTMRQKLGALQESDVSDDLVLTNKPALESEIQKRIAGQQIIEKFATNALPMIENLKEKCASLNVSEEFKQGVLKGIDGWIPQYRAMFAASIASQKADEDLLRFLDDNFQDYELKDGKILFGSIATEHQYDALAKNVQDASVEVQQFQKRRMDAINAAKASLQ